MNQRNFLQVLAVLKEHLFYRSKMEPSHIRHLQEVAYTLQQLFTEELAHLQKQQIIIPLGVDRTSEW